MAKATIATKIARCQILIWNQGVSLPEARLVEFKRIIVVPLVE
jgi:hypothetical protein